MAIVKLGWSGGKDSTCAAVLHLERGDLVKCVCYIPMFDEDIPLITREHFDFIYSAKEKLEKMGGEVYVINGKTYTEYVLTRTRRGKFAGLIYGFPAPMTGMCGFQRDSKTKAVTSFDVGYYEYMSLGIAADETARLSQLNENKRSILVELGVTEAQTYDIIKPLGLLSPHYASHTRDGCALCYNAKKGELEKWLCDYPEARQRLVELQNYCKEHRPDRAPLRGKKWFDI